MEETVYGHGYSIEVPFLKSDVEKPTAGDRGHVRYYGFCPSEEERDKAAKNAPEKIKNVISDVNASL